MPRYILIDNHSGYIFGDTADYAATEQSGLTPTEAARLLDEREVRAYGRAYREVAAPVRDTRTGYHVYRADVRGSEAVPVITDGQDQEAIEAVERDCEYVCFVAAEDATD